MTARRRSSERDEDEVRRFVESFGLVMTNAGMQRTAGRTFAALLASVEGRLTARELAETLQISPAAVSGAVRYLEQMGMVQREREPGRRADHYTLGDDPWYETMTSESRTFETMIESLGPGIQAVGRDTDAGKRLAETQDFFSFMREEMPRMYERWRASRR